MVYSSESTGGVNCDKKTQPVLVDIEFENLYDRPEEVMQTLDGDFFENVMFHKDQLKFNACNRACARANVVLLRLLQKLRKFLDNFINT